MVMLSSQSQSPISYEQESVQKTFTVGSQERNDERCISAEVKIDHPNKTIVMCGKEYAAEYPDIYMRFLGHLVIRNQKCGMNYNILLK